jgi:hypothetical protein
VPAAVVERGVASTRERAHGLEAGGVGGERVAEAPPSIGGDDERRRGGRRAEVGEPGEVGVVEVEHVTGARREHHGIA